MYLFELVCTKVELENEGENVYIKAPYSYSNYTEVKILYATPTYNIVDGDLPLWKAIAGQGLGKYLVNGLFPSKRVISAQFCW